MGIIGIKQIKHMNICPGLAAQAGGGLGCPQACPPRLHAESGCLLHWQAMQVEHVARTPGS